MRLHILALAALAAPAALAQTYYYAPDRPLAPGELRVCMDRSDAMSSRRADLEAQRRMNDRESDSIARASAQLAEDLRRLDPADTAAVADHNRRTAEHNRRVEAHNLRVHDLNVEFAGLDREQADLRVDCARPFYPQDRDAILWERNRTR
jgi:hypothetical protein